MKSHIVKKDRAKRALINRLSAAKVKLKIYFEDLDEGPSFVELTKPGIANILPPYDYDELESWWYVGNWILVAPNTATIDPVNCFRMSDRELSQLMESQQVSLLIDCFHDDIEWKVCEHG